MSSSLNLCLCQLTFLCFVLSGASEECIVGPQSPSSFNEWLTGIQKQRQTDLASINYNGSIFGVEGLQWTQSSFIQPQMHGYDRYFYDDDSHSYTYHKWLQDLIDRYGGIDSLLFWVTYTNIGADDRNQFEMNLALPGHMTGLQEMVTYFHSQTPPIRVLFPYNPWDTGTHYSGNPDYITMAQFLNETGADGFNGDTMGYVPQEFYSYSMDKYQHPIALEPEGGGSLQSLNWDTMGWGEAWTPYAYQPYVGKWKWYDGRHMTNICDRWAQNRTNDIQNAYFNAIGYESWENVWGIWNGITDRDAQQIRRVAAILRYFGNRDNNPNRCNFTQDVDWIPFIPIIESSTHSSDVFASMFTVNNATSKQQVLFLFVNRNSEDIGNLSIVFDNTFTIPVSAINVYDCYHGQHVQAQSINNDKQLNVHLDIEGLGYGAILATFDSRSSNSDLDAFLSTMNTLTKTPLKSYSAEWKYLQQELKPIASTTLYSTAPSSNMSRIPWGIFYFNSNGVEIEGNDAEGVDVQYPWELHPQREHQQFMTLSEFFIDSYPVTCSEYQQYLKDTKYSPKDTYNFLKNWQYNASSNTYEYPPGYANKPVTYVSLNEARLYCESVGKRLPHSYEWQYAAQANYSSYLYPWGNEQEMGTRFPVQQHGRSIPGPADVDAFVPAGTSVFGVSDLIGNVWQYTDEFMDNHTRAVIVRGGSNYRPDGSMWYFPNAFQLNQHNKYFLMDDSYERCGTIGFRCAADAELPTTTQKPMFWTGQGVYCKNGTDIASGVFCGRLSAGKGYTNLTQSGELDWLQFGVNSKDNSAFKMIRKQQQSQQEYYVTNISATAAVSTYSNNVRAFYWNDGENDMKVLSAADASTFGVYIDSGSFAFNVSGLKAGNVYKLRVYAGTWQNRGSMRAELKIGTDSSYLFEDSTLYEADGTADIAYEFIINLSSVSSSEVVELLISWLVIAGKGNITLQAIALQLLQ